MSVELTDFQQLTTGLHTGDPIEVVINCRFECTGWLCYAPPSWLVGISGTLDGQTSPTKKFGSIGRYGGKDNWALTFTGRMPNHTLTGKIFFVMQGQPVTRAERGIVIDNLDDLIPPPPTPPDDGVIEPEEGQERCTYPHNLEIYHNHEWILKERNSITCGYVPPEEPEEGTERCKGYNLEIYHGGRWILEERNSTRCGYSPDIPPSPPDEEEERPSTEKIIMYVLIGVIVAAIIYYFVKVRRLG